MVFLSALETKSGKAVDEETLHGKIVVLYFSSSWCPACIRFTPLLSVLHDAANEDEKSFEVVYVSSDDSATQFQDYMNKKHGNWLRVPFHSPLQNQLKATLGVFAGREQGQFPTTTRRSGIPTIVVVSKNGKELAMLDCDSSAVIQQVEAQGTAFLDQWEKFRW